MQMIPFPNHLKKLRTLMPKLLSILESGREKDWYSFIWLEETKSLSSTAAINQSTEENTGRGMVLRVLVNGLNYERATNQLNEEALIELATSFRKELEDKYSNTEMHSYKPQSWSDIRANFNENNKMVALLSDSQKDTEVHLSPNCKDNLYETDILTLNETATRNRNELLTFSKQFESEDQKLSDIRAMVRLTIITHIFVDREKNMSQTLPLAMLYAMGFSQTGQNARTLIGGTGGLDLLTLSESDRIEVTKRPLQLAKAKSIAAGRYPVITGPSVTGVIAHEAFGHTQEGDTWMKGRSIAKNLYESKTQVGNKQATIVNDPNMFSMDDKDFGTNGSYFFDHEGQFGQVQNILNEGMLSTPMTDLSSAQRLNVPRTANGKRESWKRPLMTRQTNTYFSPGDKSFDELVGMVEFGYLARHASGGMEDPKGGSLTAGTSYFEEIKNGKLTGEIFLGPSGGHIELSDPVFTILNRIVAKTSTVHDENVPEVEIGGCGKYHKEGVPAGCGGPYILWESINCG